MPPESQDRLLGKLSVKLRVAFGCGMLLLVGAAIAPAPAPRAVLSVPEERAAPLIGEQVQARASAQVFRGLQSLAARVAEHSIVVPQPVAPVAPSVRDYALEVGRQELPAASGVFVTADGGVLTHEATVAGQSALEVLTAGGQSIAMAIVAHERSTGMVLLRPGSPVAGVQVPPFALSSEPGALVVGAVRWEGRTVALPAFIASTGTGSGYLLTAAAGSIPPGTPVYDVDGQLVAIAASRAGAATTAIPAGDALARLTELAASGQGVVPAIGADLQAIVGSLATFYGNAGVLLADVVPGGPAAAAGLVPGDILLDVGGTAVDSPESALLAIGESRPRSAIELRVRARGAQPRTATVTVAPVFEVNSLARAVLFEDTEEQPEAGAIFSLAQLGAAGVPAAARVRQLNGRAITSRTQALAELRRLRPPFVLHVAHEGRRFFAALDAEP